MPHDSVPVPKPIEGSVSHFKLDKCLYIPDSRVVSPEPHDEVALRISHESIPSHRRSWELGMVVRVVVPSILFRSPDDLEVVSMKMERMLPGVIIIQDDLYDLTVLKDESVCIATIDYGIRSSIPGGKDGVQSRDLWCDIGDVVEEGTGTILSMNTT